MPPIRIGLKWQNNFGRLDNMVSLRDKWFCGATPQNSIGARPLTAFWRERIIKPRFVSI